MFNRFPFLAFLATSTFAATVDFAGQYNQPQQIAAGQVVEISVGLPEPSKLPVNGRIAVEWEGYRKVLHALDPDFYMLWRAPKSGNYTLKVTKVEDEEPIFNLPRWRETGIIPKITAFPRLTSWPVGAKTKLRAVIRPVNFGESKRGMIVEVEPNDSIATAQAIAIGASGGEETLHITGSADDIEYFDNGKVGEAGLDWFRIDFKGTSPRLFTANLTVADPLVVHQVLFYTADGKEFREGANANERVHQQQESHRTEISRTLQPGGVYYLKVEANSPGYEVELRLRDLAPYSDPRKAVRQAMYDHMAQVDAWLLNRPRGAAVERRIRDVGNLMGTHCMSCHTQSGVWGPAVAIANGYKVENVANLRHLITVMYECLRPTNTLKDAANNTSLAPLDLGDGPAGTRAAGFNVSTIEKQIAPKRLHSAQQIRAANHVLQSADPSGINAAGPGSNVGQSIVYRFAGTILRTAFDKTQNDKYLIALEEKAQSILGVVPRYNDDLSNRILFFQEVFPKNYVALKEDSDEAKNFVARASAQVAADERRIRQTQRPDGMWQFDAGKTENMGATWNIKQDEKDIDPAPTALALTALHSLGYTDKDAVVKRGVEALLRRQDTYGRWNNHALTGFVTTAYTLHALSRLYPDNVAKPTAVDFEPRDKESLVDTVARFREMAQLGFAENDRNFLPYVIPGTQHESPQVRYWAFIALGAIHDERYIEQQLKGLGDPVKMVREAARWGMRQTLIDDKGWDYLYPAYQNGDDLTRESIAAALIMRTDGVMTHTSANYAKLGATFDQMMNRDAHPGVRAWSSRAAWNWWIWNQPIRNSLNQAFFNLLETAEPNALAEISKRYQTEALFIVNGQRANPSSEHQYPELNQLFDKISKRIDQPNNQLVVQRLVNIASTFYNQAGGDGGPGQMGYVTPKSGEMIGKAVLSYWQGATSKEQVRLAVEAAALAPYEALQNKLLNFSTTGDEELRTIAATSISDPRVITLPGTQEFLEPLLEQFQRGSIDAQRRAELTRPLERLFSRARWNLPKTDEQQRLFYSLMIPKFTPERGALEENTRELKQMDSDSADWFLARSLGRVVHANADLQTDNLFAFMPEKYNTPMDEMVWLPSISWMLTYKKPMPEVAGNAPSADPYKNFRDRAAQLLIKELTTPNVDSRLKSEAMRLATDVQVRDLPQVKAVLEKQRPAYYEAQPAEVTAMSPEWKRNFEYFRKWVVPELMKPQREDERACLSCHAVAGRVPSMELVDHKDGFMSDKTVYANYKLLQERVNETNVEQSKLLRKPLNVQSGKEDGHQGGRRFNPEDRGYQILRRWVLDTAQLKQGQK